MTHAERQHEEHLMTQALAEIPPGRRFSETEIENFLPRIGQAGQILLNPEQVKIRTKRRARIRRWLEKTTKQVESSIYEIGPDRSIRHKTWQKRST